MYTVRTTLNDCSLYGVENREAELALRQVLRKTLRDHIKIR